MENRPVDGNLRHFVIKKGAEKKQETIGGEGDGGGRGVTAHTMEKNLSSDFPH